MLDHDELQKQWDRWLVMHWRKSPPVFQVIYFFISRLPEYDAWLKENISAGPTVESTLKMLHELTNVLKLRRVPLGVWASVPLGVWLANCFPTFLDEVIKLKDANLVDLSKLVFRNTAPKQRGAKYGRELESLRKQSIKDINRSVVNGQQLKIGNRSKNRLKGH